MSHIGKAAENLPSTFRLQLQRGLAAGTPRHSEILQYLRLHSASTLAVLPNLIVQGLLTLTSDSQRPSCHATSRLCNSLSQDICWAAHCHAQRAVWSRTARLGGYSLQKVHMNADRNCFEPQCLSKWNASQLRRLHCENIHGSRAVPAHICKGRSHGRIC